MSSPTPEPRTWTPTPERTSSPSTDNRPTNTHINPFVWLIIIVVLVVVSAGFALITMRKAEYAAKSAQDPVCRSRDCLEHASHLKVSINTDVNPCKNLYSYTCAFWYKDYSYKDPKDIETMLSDNILHTLTSGKLDLQSKAVARAFAVFQSCIHRKDDLDAFKRFTTDMRIPWPEEPFREANALDVNLQLLIRWRISFLFSIKVVPSTNNKEPVLVIWKAMEVQSWKQLRNGEAQTISQYAARVRQFAHALGHNETLSDSYVHQLRMDELNVMKLVESGRKSPYSEHFFGLRQLQNYTKNITTDEWVSFINKNLEPQFHLTTHSMVLVHSLPVLHMLGRIVEIVPNERLLVLLGWIFVQECAWMASTKFDIATWGSKRQAEQHAPAFCLRQIEDAFGILPWAPFIYKNFPKRERDKVNAVLDNIVSTIQENLERSTLISNATKETASAKLRKMKRVLWPTETFFSEQELDVMYLSFDPANGTFFQRWVRSMTDVGKLRSHKDFLNLYSKTMNDKVFGPIVYLYYFNILKLSMAAVISPVYYRHGNMAMSYGSLGTLYAVFLSKFIDSLGRQIDDKGQKRDWWESQVSHKCKSYGDRRMTNLFGFDASYDAFKTALFGQKNKALNSRLDTLSMYTGEQIFFLSACRPLCSRGEFGKEVCNAALDSTAFLRSFNCSEEPSWYARNCRML
ncbi:endothelin-converting enzyme 2-like [Ornithodoros turicata]|uniref:endothelin-converting enzyme 2-like n=1 Tax=Ornithodoros turicata TaxID=34597 RepID=UPI0031399864